MSRFSDPHSPMAFVSRLISRSVRVRAGIGGAGSRMIAALVAVILFAAQPSVRFERDTSADAFRSASPAAAFVAMHSVPATRLHRTGSDSRASSHWPSTNDASLPSRPWDALLESSRHHFAIDGEIGHAAASVVARGYDATAPPALS